MTHPPPPPPTQTVKDITYFILHITHSDETFKVHNTNLNNTIKVVNYHKLQYLFNK